MSGNNLHLPGDDDGDYTDSADRGDSPGDARRRWPLAAAVVVLALAAVGAGVAVAATMGSKAPAAASSPAPSETPTTPAATPSTNAAAAPSQTATPTATATTPAAANTQPPTDAVADWRTFTSADRRISFEYPGTWTATQAPPANTGSTDVEVADESGVIVASLHSGPSGGVGGACEGPVPYTVLDSVNVDIPYQPTKGSVSPRFAFRALQEADHVTASYGLTSSPAGQNGSTCMFYNIVSGPSDSPLFSFADAYQVNTGVQQQIPGHKGPKSFPTMDDARAYMQSAEYLDAKRMITSLKVTQG